MKKQISHTFTYNADGMRIRRICEENDSDNCVIYKYVYDGSLLPQMSVAGNVLRFTYDADGTPLTVIYNDITYYYVVNLQGDIVAILDSTGTEIVSYTYDAWGNVTTNYDQTQSIAEILSELNPLRYRGYVYDTETGLYYLQSRYYNPQWGRFISADGQISDVGEELLGNNMFAYCFNNPINMSDPDGKWAKLLKEVGARLVFAVEMTARIFTSPLKAITAEVGSGVGFGGSAQVTSVVGVPVKIGASATITDSIIYDKGKFDVRNTSSAEIGLDVGKFLSLSSSKGKSHSYFDEQCTCSFWDSTFGEKHDCLANTKHTSNDYTVGISGGVYLGIGIEFGVSFDFKAWKEEALSIYHDSLSFKGYY